jgi:Uma2 family endonuclease
MKNTVDDYFAMEREAEERHIYLDGEIVAISGASNEHGDISVNIAVSLATQVKGTPRRVRTKGTKIYSGPVSMSGKSTSGMFSYPDVLVVCGEPEFHDAHKDVLLNPTVVVEVLSKDTEAFNRGEKFRRYRKWNPTLKDYLLVSQDKPQIEHFVRQPDGTWSYACYEGLESQVVIASIQCVLKLAEVYDRIRFSEE